MRTYGVKIGDNEIQVADYPGEKGPILAIHGLTGNKFQLQFFAEHLSPRYRVITMDLRGRGDSSPAEEHSSIFHHAADIKLLAEKLEIEKPIVMGYSMGGFVVALAAAEMEVQAVILLDGAATMDGHQKPIVEPSFSRLGIPFDTEEGYINQVTENYANLNIPPSKKLKDLLAYEVKEVDGKWFNKAIPEAIKADWSTFWQFDARRIIASVAAPVLLVQAAGKIGSHPPLFLPEHYAETIRAAKQIQVVTSDASHYTMVFEEREDINGWIDAFLDRNE